MKKNKLKEIRESKKIKVEQMAYLVGLNSSTYYRYETGERSVPVDAALKISEVLNISVEDVFTPNKFTIKW